MIPGAELRPSAAVFASLAATTAALLGGLEELPAAFSFRFQLWGGLVLKRLVMVEQGRCD
jgi:hypothetical protein